MYKHSYTIFRSMEKKLETKRKELMICLYKNETNSIKPDTLKGIKCVPFLHSSHLHQNLAVIRIQATTDKEQKETGNNQPPVSDCFDLHSGDYQ